MLRVLAFTLLAAVLLASQRCRAADWAPRSLWLNTGGISWHAEPGFNSHNPGLAIEARWDDTWAATAGRIKNSEGAYSRLAAVIYTPWSFDAPVLGRMHVGGLAGITDGYARNNGKPIPAAGLLVDKRFERVAVGVVAFPAVDKTSAAVVVFFRWRFN